MSAPALLALLEDWREEAERALRIHRHLEHRNDLLAELWLVHHALSAGAGRELDPCEPTDRQALLQGWRARLRFDGNREQRRTRQTTSAHSPAHADAPHLPLIDTFAATPASDPLEALDRLEAAMDRLMVPSEVEGTWSQPAGYLSLYERVGERLRDLAEVCGTTDSALRARLHRLMEIHRVQARLFDGVHRLGDEDVAPPRPRARHVRDPGEGDPQAPLWLAHDGAA